MLEYINKDICSECGGNCCKKNGCAYLPEDFKSMEYEYLYNLIKEGNISIELGTFEIHTTDELCEKFNIKNCDDDLWSYYLYLKVRNVNSEIINFVGNESQCSMLTENGCAYSDSERPTYGLSLIPKKGKKCEQIANKFTCEVIYDWIKHQDVLRKIVCNLTNKTIKQLLKEAAEEDIHIRQCLEYYSSYINPVDAIEAEIKYLDKKINKKTNVKKLILK